MSKKARKDQVISSCEKNENEGLKSNLSVQNELGEKEEKKQEIKFVPLKKASFLKENRGLMIALVSLVGLYFYNQVIGKLALENTLFQFQSMLLIIPPVFILLGLLDVWVDRETMIKYMGKDSKAKGIIISFLLGSCVAGPLYGAFPMVAILLKKGLSFLIF